MTHWFQSAALVTTGHNSGRGLFIMVDIAGFCPRHRDRACGVTMRVSWLTVEPPQLDVLLAAICYSARRA